MMSAPVQLELLEELEPWPIWPDELFIALSSLRFTERLTTAAASRTITPSSTPTNTTTPTNTPSYTPTNTSTPTYTPTNTPTPTTTPVISIHPIGNNVSASSANTCSDTITLTNYYTYIAQANLVPVVGVIVYQTVVNGVLYNPYNGGNRYIKMGWGGNYYIVKINTQGQIVEYQICP